MPKLISVPLFVLCLIFFGCTSTSKPPRPAEPSLTPGYDNEAVEEALRSGDTAGALELLEGRIKDNPDDIDARLFSVSLLLSQNRIGEARNILEELLAIHPDNPRVLIQLAFLEGWDGNTQKRLAILSDLREKHPDNSDVWSALGDHYLWEENPEEALTMYETALRLDPKHPDALAGAGVIMMEKKEYAKAEEFFDRYIAGDQNDPFVYADRGRVRMIQGKIRPAEEDFSRAIELYPDYWNYIDRGKLRLSYLNDQNGALEDFSRAIEINPDFFYAYIYRAGIYDSRDEFEPAIADYKALLRLNPDYVFTYKSLGILQYIQGHWEDARKNLQEAAKHEDDTGLLFLAGYTYYRQGKEREGRTYFTDLMNLFTRDEHFYNLARMMTEPGYSTFVQRGIEQENDLFVKMRMKFYLGAAYEALNGAPVAANLYREVQTMNIYGLYEWRIAVKALEALGDKD